MMLMNQKDQLKGTIKVTHALWYMLASISTDNSNHSKLDYVQDIIEVYLNTEIQGQLF